MNVSEKEVAEIMKTGFFLWRDCPNFEVAKEIIDEMDTYIYIYIYNK